MRKKRMFERKPFVAPDGYLTRKEAIAFLGISQMTVYVWEQRGLLHPERIGSYAIYPIDELEQLRETKKG